MDANAEKLRPERINSYSPPPQKNTYNKFKAQTIKSEIHSKIDNHNYHDKK